MCLREREREILLLNHFLRIGIGATATNEPFSFFVRARSYGRERQRQSVSGRTTSSFCDKVSFYSSREEHFLANLEQYYIICTGGHPNLGFGILPSKMAFDNQMGSEVVRLKF